MSGLNLDEGLPDDIQNELYLLAQKKQKGLLNKKQLLEAEKNKIEEQLKEIGKQLKGYQLIMKQTESAYKSKRRDDMNKTDTDITEYFQLEEITRPIAGHVDYPRHGWKEKVLYVLKHTFEYCGRPLRAKEVAEIVSIEEEEAENIAKIKVKVLPILSRLVGDKEAVKLELRWGSENFYAYKEWMDGNNFKEEYAAILMDFKVKED